MGLCIALQSESGEQIDSVDDERNLLGKKLLGYPDQRAFPMLSSIDYYGDTTFNRMQIGRFLNEWKTLFAKATTPDEISLLEAVKAMSEKLRDSVHLYLVFTGD
jgi:hypothetical protein